MLAAEELLETLPVGRPRRPAKKAALGNLMWYYSPVRHRRD